MPPFQNNNEYENTNFSDFTPEIKRFEKINFLRCKFKSCNLSDKEFKKCVFEKCTFTNCSLNMIKLTNSRLSECKFESCKMVGIDWSLTNNKMGMQIEAKDCDLSYNIFAEVDLSESEFIDCKIREADFTKSKAQKVKFQGSDLGTTIFNKTNLKKADFTNAYNYHFDPSKNTLKKAVFDKPEVLNLLEIYGLEIKD